jgi:hypothetical protein
MSERPCKVLIFDWDENALITLQRALEDAGVDTTVTWDEGEARSLIQNTPFDVILVGDHPPQFTDETIVHEAFPSPRYRRRSSKTRRLKSPSTGARTLAFKGIR